MILTPKNYELMEESESGATLITTEKKAAEVFCT